MLLRPRRPPPPAPPSPARSDLEADPGASPAPAASPGSPAPPASPGSPVSPGSAQRTPWSERETELLLGTLLQPAVWRALLLDRRRALPTYRRVSAALARQQVRRTPAQCRRRYKFLRDKLRDAHDQPPGPFDPQIRELVELLGDHGPPRSRRRSPGRPQRARRPASSAPAEPGAALPPGARDADADPSWTLRFSASPLKADAPRPPGSPPALSGFDPAFGRPEGHAPFRDPDGSSPPPPPPPPSPAREDPALPPGSPEQPAPAPPTLNAALLQTLGHLGDIVTILGPLRDQLLTLNQHVEQLRGSFDQTVSLAVGFILGSAAAERGVLGDPRQ